MALLLRFSTIKVGGARSEGSHSNLSLDVSMVETKFEDQAESQPQSSHLQEATVEELIPTLPRGQAKNSVAI